MLQKYGSSFVYIAAIKKFQFNRTNFCQKGVPHGKGFRLQFLACVKIENEPT